MTSQPAFHRTLKAGGTIAKWRIVKFGADDDHVIQGAAATDSLIGVVDLPGDPTVTAAAEDRVDVVRGGEVDVKAGGTITRGDLVTSDASGQAVTAAPSTGANNRILGVAMKSAVSGDVIPVLIGLCNLQG